MLYTTLKEIMGKKPCPLEKVEKVEKLKAFIDFEANGFTETSLIPLSDVLKSDGLNYTYWVLNFTEKGQHLLRVYTLWNAEKVLHIWEKEYPNDNSIRLTIEAAKKAIEDPTEENKQAAYAAYAADDYGYGAAGNAAYAARYAAYAATAAVYAVYTAAANTALYAAAAVAHAAYTAVPIARYTPYTAYDEAYEEFEKEQETELLRLLEEATP